MKAILYLVFTAGAVLAQSDAELKKAEDSWVSAIKTNDAAAMRNVLADELVYTHSTSLVDTKDSYIKSIQSGSQTYEDVEYSDVKMRRYGDTGLVTAKVRMRGKTKGVPFDNQLRITHVWVKREGRWQLVAHQTTRINPA